MKKHKVEAYALIILALVALLLTSIQGNLIYLFIYCAGVMFYAKHTTQKVSNDDNNF